MSIPAFMAILAARAEAASPRNPGDYIGKDGLLYCGDCHEPKQCRPFEQNPSLVVCCVCKCVQEEQERIMQQIRDDEQRSRQLAVERDCFFSCSADSETKERNADFSLDDQPDSQISHIARRYAERFSKNGDWLLLYGTTGVGKSFYAACICKQLLSEGFSCRFTSISEIEKRLWNAEDKSQVYSEIASYDLLVIDDFGAERDTEYIREIQFNVMDYRLRVDRPCIITTNLTAEEILRPSTKDMRRILSRVYERSIPVEVKGVDRRREALRAEMNDRLRRLLE